VEDYDEKNNMYRVDIRNGWVAPSKLSLREDVDPNSRQPQKKRRTDKAEGGLSPSAVGADGGLSSSAPANGGASSPAPADGGLSPSAPADGELSSSAPADGGLSLAVAVPADPPADASTFSSYVTKVVEDLKKVGTPWEAMMATFASSSDALGQTLEVARAKVFIS